MKGEEGSPNSIMDHALKESPRVLYLCECYTRGDSLLGARKQLAT